MIFACVGNLGHQEATNSLFVCTAGAFGTLHSLFLEASPRAKHLVIEKKDFQREGKKGHILLSILAHLLKSLLELVSL